MGSTLIGPHPFWIVARDRVIPPARSCAGVSLPEPLLTIPLRREQQPAKEVTAERLPLIPGKTGIRGWTVKSRVMGLSGSFAEGFQLQLDLVLGRFLAPRSAPESVVRLPGGFLLGMQALQLLFDE